MPEVQTADLIIVVGPGIVLAIAGVLIYWLRRKKP